MLAVCVEIQPRSKIPNTEKLNTCMEKENYCGECCTFAIGDIAADEEFRNICKDKCNAVLNPPLGADISKLGLKSIVMLNQSLGLNTEPPPVPEGGDAAPAPSRFK